MDNFRVRCICAWAYKIKSLTAAMYTIPNFKCFNPQLDLVKYIFLVLFHLQSVDAVPNNDHASKMRFFWIITPDATCVIDQWHNNKRIIEIEKVKMRKQEGTHQTHPCIIFRERSENKSCMNKEELRKIKG